MLSPLLIPYLHVQAMKNEKYKGTLSERFAEYGVKKNRIGSSGTIWLHAVSVGEAVGAIPLIRLLQEKEVGTPVVVSTTTKGGMEILEKTFGDKIIPIYFPLDFPWVIRRALNVLKPRALILMETEIWPNLIVKSDRKGVPVMLMNGRVSDRMVSASGIIKKLYKTVFKSIRILGMQTQKDADRIIELGANENKVHVVGNMKFDGQMSDIDSDKINRLKDIFKPGEAGIVIAGSTHPGEEEMLLDAYKSITTRNTGIRLVIAPRHIERAAEVVDIVRSKDLEPVLRSSLSEDSMIKDEVIILDTIGELRYLYSLAELCFVGGSLIERGGHNILEPAACGKAAFYGPYMMNFESSVNVLEENNGGIQVRNEEDIVSEFNKYLNNKEYRDSLDANAFDVVKRNAGAADRAYRLFKECVK